jgi:hypothetical protein
MTDEFATVTDHNTSITYGNHSEVELANTTTETTAAILTDLSPTIDKYSDCAIHHLTKLRHHTYPELSLVRYDTTIVKSSPVTGAITLSGNVTPPDGRIQLWSNDTTSDEIPKLLVLL